MSRCWTVVSSPQMAALKPRKDEIFRQLRKLFNTTVVTQAFVCCSTYRSPHAEGMQPDSTSVYPPTRTSRDPRGASSAYSKPAQGQSRSSPLDQGSKYEGKVKNVVIAVFLIKKRIQVFCILLSRNELIWKQPFCLSLEWVLRRIKYLTTVVYFMDSIQPLM